MTTIRDRLWQQYQQAAQSVWDLPPADQNDERTAHLPPLARPDQRNRPRTILVHGYKDDASVFEPLASYLSELGFIPYAVTLEPSDCSVPLEALAQQLAHFVETNFAYDQKLDLIGFSLGGIVTRYFVQRMGGLARTNRLLTVAAPHHGTWMAYASNLPAAVQLRPKSAFLRDLNSDAELLDGVPFISIWNPLDLMVLPSLSGRIPVAANLAVWTLRHQDLITSPRGMRAIAEQLLAQPESLVSPASPEQLNPAPLQRKTAGKAFELQRQS